MELKSGECVLGRIPLSRAVSPRSDLKGVHRPLKLLSVDCIAFGGSQLLLPPLSRVVSPRSDIVGVRRRLKHPSVDCIASGGKHYTESIELVRSSTPLPPLQPVATVGGASPIHPCGRV